MKSDPFLVGLQVTTADPCLGAECATKRKIPDVSATNVKEPCHHRQTVCIEAYTDRMTCTYGSGKTSKISKQE